ncbi:hypothetical protein [Ochrobactrum soli]|nr:hypothetical protein [[Ochrobactrum] soli]
MNDELPIEWKVMTPIEKKEIIDLLKRAGIEGARELLADLHLKHPSKER